MCAAMLLSHVTDDDEYEIVITPLSRPHIIVLLTVNSTVMTSAVHLTAGLNGVESHCRKKVSGQ